MSPACQGLGGGLGPESGASALRRGWWWRRRRRRGRWRPMKGTTRSRLAPRLPPGTFGEVCEMRSVRVLSAIVVSSTGRSTGRFVDDQSITASVKAKLVADKAANLTRVGVKTVNGTVYLTGSV